MWTGRQTLSSIEDAIANLHKEEGQLDTALRSAVAETERLRKERSEALRELARIKLDEMAAGRLVSSLDAGERRAVQILDDYRLRIAATAERREGLLKEVAAAETQRNAAAAAVEEALAAVEAIRADTEAKVQTASAWQAAKRAFEEAEAVASEAEKKAASSEAELGAKRKPYDDDPLFTYLWSRKFGTRDYQGGNFARLHGSHRGGLHRLQRRACQLRGPDRNSAAAAGARNREAYRSGGAAGRAVRRRAARHGRGRHRAQGASPGRGAPQAGGGRPDARGEARAAAQDRGGAQDAGRRRQQSRLQPSPGDDLVRRRQGRSRTALRGGAADTHERGRCDRSQARDHRRKCIQNGCGSRQAAPLGPGSRTTAPGSAASPRSLPRCRLRPSQRDLRQRRRHRRCSWSRARRARSTAGSCGTSCEAATGTDSPRGRPDFGAPNFPFPFPIPGGGTNSSSGGGWREPSSRGGWSPREDYPDRSGGDDDRFTTGGSF